ncbi:MAG TPA: deoxyribose-phosphate aldolase [Bryobacteraceae bacterium]|nr:deoxyribose-phosphate aldolase [Bryobacteraceae bacterium]
MQPTGGPTGEDVRPALATYEDLAKLLDHAVLRPDFSDEQIAEGCEIAKQYNVAAVIVRPSDVDLAKRWVAGSSVTLGSVISYPEGSETTSVKLYATQDLLRRGAREIDTVINIGKMISRQFQYVEMELQQIAKACHDAGAILKVTFENAYLTEDLKIIACKICKRSGVDYARTGTPFSPSAYSLDDIALMRRHLGERVKLKASAGIRTVDQVLELHRAGCDRVGTIATVAILEAWKAELARRAQPAQPAS